MLSHFGRVTTFVLLSCLLIICLNRIVCKSEEKALDENQLFLQFENELLETYKKGFNTDMCLRMINCTNIAENKSYKHHTPVTIVASNGMVGDFRSIFKCNKTPAIVRKVSDGVYSVESFYRFSALVYLYATVNMSIHGVYNKSEAAFLMDSHLRANFTMGLSPAERFMNVTKVELLNCTVAKQMVNTGHDAVKYIVPHVAEMFFEHFLRKEKLRVEDCIKRSFREITNNSTFLLGSG